MSEKICSIPTADSPNVKTVQDNSEKEVAEASEMNKTKAAMSGTLNSIGDAAESALKNLTGLIANIASYGSAEKIDYDKDGNQIVDGIGEYQKRYRSSANLEHVKDIKKAIEEQRKELAESKKIKKEGFEFITDNDILSVIEETQYALEARIFGPLWYNWTTGEDFLAAIKYTLQSIIDTFDPLMEMVDELQDFVNNSTSGLEDKGISIKTATGNEAKLPLGIMAIQSLNIIINYIRDLIRNIEMIAEEYTVEELNALLRRSKNDPSWGTVIKSLHDLIQLIINCMKPYVHNLVMALILDAIDLIVDKLDKAGILSPSGPLKLIPIAITLVRAILRGDLEAIEEMVEKTLTKMINLVQLAFIGWKDPSIFWADTDRLDKEIAIARYDELAADGNFSAEDRNKFIYMENEGPLAYLNGSKNLAAGARHFLQKMAGENRETLNQIGTVVSNWTDWSTAYRNHIASKQAKSKNTNKTLAEAQAVSADMTAMNNGIAKNLKEPNDG